MLSQYPSSRESRRPTFKKNRLCYAATSGECEYLGKTSPGCDSIALPARYGSPRLETGPGQNVKPIEFVEIGDLVWAWDGITGALIKQPVSRLFRHKDKPILKVMCVSSCGVHQTIEATTEHPFWIEGKGWVAACELQVGDVLKRIDGGFELRLRGLVNSGRKADVFNFEVRGVHNYFVGKAGVLVHNQSSHKPDITPISQTEGYHQRSNGDTVIAWTKGPSKGRVYQIIERPTDIDLGSARRFDAINAEVDCHIIEASRRSDSAEPVQALWRFIHEAYYGSDSASGLRITAFYSPEHRAFLTDITKTHGGVVGWVENRAKGLGISLKDSYLHSYMKREKLWDFFYARPSMFPESEFLDSSDPIELAHSTYSSALPSIFNEGSLKADRFRHPELPKLTGEWGGDEKAWSSSEVSFWAYRNTAAKIQAFGTQPALDYPIMFGIGRSQIGKLSIESGGMSGERRVKESVPLQYVTHVFVPDFMMREVRGLFVQHEYPSVQVMPLAFEGNKPIVR